MYKLLFKLSLLLLPVILLVMLIPVDRRWQFQYLEYDGYGHALWIYDRIHDTEHPIKCAIIGTSRSLNAVNEKILAKDNYEDPTSIANLAYYRSGRNLHYVIAEEMFEAQKPDILILEVRDYESPFTHPVFGHMANTKDAVFGYPFINRDILNLPYKHLTYKWQICRDLLLKDVYPKVFETDMFGHGSFDTIAPKEELLAAKLNRQERHERLIYTEININMIYPKHYLKKIGELCRDHGTDLIFYYHPGYGMVLDTPYHYTFLKEYGEVWFTPDSIREDMDLWYDPDHLNTWGSNELSDWMNVKLNDYLNNN